MYQVGVQEGLINYVWVGLAFFQRILEYLVDFSTGGFGWTIAADGQLAVAGTIPDLTPKGEDIVGALMTIIHNGIVAAAQFVTLLPVNVS